MAKEMSCEHRTFFDQSEKGKKTKSNHQADQQANKQRKQQRSAAILLELGGDYTTALLLLCHFNSSACRQVITIRFSLP